MTVGGWGDSSFYYYGKDAENLSPIRIKCRNNYSVTKAPACLEHDAG